MAWYSIDMPETSVTDGAYHRFCREFQRAFIGAGAPADLALFACRKKGRETRRLYLSPHAASYVPDLIQVYGAQPCGVPEDNTVTLVYGVPNARALLSRTEAGHLNGQREVSTIYPISRARQAVSSG